ncbi:metallophosphoesterase family protein [Cystobacter fuscus]
MAPDSLLVVGVGDIHGRFHRVEAWLDALEEARRRPVDLVLAVGDVEAFRLADDHRRKAAKRGMPAEFAAYADGVRAMKRPLYFIGGNNEDFEALHDEPEGFSLAPNVHYLGRAGLKELLGLRVGYLSGIHAPRFYEQPLKRPRSLDTAKQAGYFRAPEVERVMALRDMDVLLVHEWPRGLPQRAQERETPPPGRTLPSYWIGNPITRRLVETVHPRWVLCGHSHRAFAVSLGGGRAPTRVACLDQAAGPRSRCSGWSSRAARWCAPGGVPRAGVVAGGAALGAGLAAHAHRAAPLGTMG